MKKLWIIGALLLMSFAASEAASKEKIQVVYRGNESGEWQVWIFGAYCPANMKLHTVSAGNGSDPIKLQCVYER